MQDLRSAPNSKIIVRLIGGLGNQMFQYAAARAVAKRRGASLKLDISDFANYPLRRYELDAYPIVASIASTKDIEGIYKSTDRVSSMLGNLVALVRRPPINHYREPHYHYDAALATQWLPLYMDGYWQSERYFADIASDIRAELTPTAPLEPDNAAIAAEIEQVNAVSIHVRRGDFVDDPKTMDFHGGCSLEYYLSTIAMIRDRCERPHLFAFSDDPDWCRRNLKTGLPTTFVSNNAGRIFRDIQLMSLCRHHILANSSFGWWGAWLNTRPGKIVIGPTQWFNEPRLDTRDLCPPDWLRI